MARKKGGRRYTEEQKQEILRRVMGGESQTAVAAETGIPAVTIGYWLRKARRAASIPRKRVRPRAAARDNRGIASTLDGDTLVVRIPLRAFARQMAQKALAEI